MDKYLESYIEGLRIDEPYNLIRYKGKEEFDRKLRECISPLHQIAMNQGFLGGGGKDIRVIELNIFTIKAMA